MIFRTWAAAAVVLVGCQAIKLVESHDDGVDFDDVVLAQAEVETSTEAEAMAEAEAQFLAKLIKALFDGKNEIIPYDQRAPNMNVVDNARFMVPEGADPTCVKTIISEIQNNGIGGIRGAMGMVQELGGPGGWDTFQLPAKYM